MTAIYGSGKTGEIPRTDKLGGLVLKMLDPDELETPWINKQTFNEV